MIDRRRVDNGGLILLLVLATVALAMVVSAYASALLWAALAAVLFQPLFRRLDQRWPGHRNSAATLTLLIITVAVIIPAMVIASLVIDQASGVYLQLRSGQINFALYFQQVHDALPLRVQNLLGSAGLGTFERAQMRLSEALSNSASMLTQRALAIGANAAAFMLAFGVGLYVTFFLVRDGDELGAKIVKALPLEQEVADRLASVFITVVRATLKGSGLVALAQGALGAITFSIVGLPAAMLWGMLMAIAALLPAIGPAIIWGPVAIYLYATGAIWEGSVVVASGVFVIGLSDNILRPMLVGRDAGIPDWLVLVTTLGGIEIMGLSGIVVGPLAGALFIASWQILTEQRALNRKSAIAP
ncbi:MAG: AI-2E family transporter [Novosphingobium sp. 28-62-57]|uniref:AI-2E family transporter n=1 Tax=unclassified Novosphingobium TaxID=2644732 RepID=UPI000BCA86C7|nr:MULTISPECIES: AI-2E family transporter [unclassified Novosphingobium]OYW49701.1 MAG: AI-2E family transporter [Novosphingobium sp. 12-62-10]OYZ12342.1 MAG: AI-2E family transporter [Novosphingobium sp. 28-62-57]OZA33455.1 MAG: AI-2E family transporter [Novosphingobium sp. 17-62-9]HQS70704.1 AI-2E family transporter [Novosphingobium sp.]